jgi:hypothetical protein
MTLLKPALLFSLLLGPAFAPWADDVMLPAVTDQAPATGPVPGKGQTMTEVVRRFGEPQDKHPPVGGDAPTHPPITRWDYPGFSVFFEHSHVVDSVVPGHPPPIQHQDQLQPATTPASGQ